MKNKRNFTIEGYRWFQKSYGNTYHSVRILEDSKVIGTVIFSYGYEDQYIQTAHAWLVENNHMSQSYSEFNRDLNNVFTVKDVKRKKDLFNI